jgi:hypothetical protein
MVPDLDAADDFAWFAANPQRSYRLRKGVEGWWIVEKRSDAFLRVWTATIADGLPDTDGALAAVWTRAAYPSQPR